MQCTTTADPEFPVWWGRRCAAAETAALLAKMFVKTKELGPAGTAQYVDTC